jgi:hypothetical protein
MVNKRFTLLLGIVFSLAVTCAGFAQATKTGSLATTDEKGISGKRLRELLDSYISDTNAHSTIAVLTQCYGGNMVGTLSDGRANTHVSSATSAGEQAYYGGYDDDAASATKPGAGTTSGDVHDAGTAGKSSSETPSEGGSDQPLDPVNPTDGPIKSRHILIYAGTPDGGNGTSDDDQRNKIVGNFAGEPNTSVTTVGGAGGAGSPGAGWQHPGTEAGLKDALNTIKAQMNSDEQFILFVTDHGDQDVDDQNCVETFPGTYQSVPLQFDNPVYLDMYDDPDNEAAVTIFVPFEFQPGPCDISVGSQFIPGVPFETIVDIDNDGNFDPGDGDGWEARAVLEETLLDMTGDEVVAQNLPPGQPGVGARLTSGAIPKVHFTSTVGSSLTCAPSSGTVPFSTTINLALSNNVPGPGTAWTRRVAAHIDMELGNGSFIGNWRAGFTNIGPNSSYTTNWNQSIPAIPSVLGVNTIQLIGEDVTPSPFNQPPYPPSGDTSSDACTVVANAP